MNTIVWEYTAGNKITFNTDDLKIEIRKPYFSVDIRVDGEIVVSDPDIRQRVFTFSSVISGAIANTLHDIIMGGTIAYSAALPNIDLITWASGVTEADIEVAIQSVTLTDLGNYQWGVNMVLVEKTQ